MNAYDCEWQRLYLILLIFSYLTIVCVVVQKLSLQNKNLQTAIRSHDCRCYYSCDAAFIVPGVILVKGESPTVISWYNRYMMKQTYRVHFILIFTSHTDHVVKIKIVHWKTRIVTALFAPFNFMSTVLELVLGTFCSSEQDLLISWRYDL